MKSAEDDSLETWLRRWKQGDPLALEHLLPLIYADLRSIARRVMGGVQGHETLQPTALVHEVLLRFMGRESGDFESGAHLLNACARMMRQVLVDRARRAAAEKRGGTWRREDEVELGCIPIPDGTDLLALDQALALLESQHARMAQVVELTHFVGLTAAEVSQLLGVTPRTAERDLAAARMWLRDCLEPECQT